MPHLRHNAAQICRITTSLLASCTSHRPVPVCTRSNCSLSVNTHHSMQQAWAMLMWHCSCNPSTIHNFKHCFEFPKPAELPTLTLHDIQHACSCLRPSSLQGTSQTANVPSPELRRMQGSALLQLTCSRTAAGTAPFGMHLHLYSNNVLLPAHPATALPCACSSSSSQQRNHLLQTCDTSSQNSTGNAKLVPMQVEAHDHPLPNTVPHP